MLYNKILIKSLKKYLNFFKIKSKIKFLQLLILVFTTIIFIEFIIKIKKKLWVTKIILNTNKKHFR